MQTTGGVVATLHRQAPGVAIGESYRSRERQVGPEPAPTRGSLSLISDRR